MTLRRCHKPAISFLILGACLVAATALAGEAEKPVRVEGDVRKPVKVHGPAPAYPPELKKERIEGQVIASTVISKEGRVESIEIVQAPHEEFGDAVRESLSQWKFEPATLDGQPVAVYYHLTINFKLDSDSKAAAEEKPAPSAFD